MEHRLGDTEENQTDTHSGTEQHGKPGSIGVIRFGIVGAQPDAFKSAEKQINYKYEEDGYRYDIKPSEFCDDKILDFVEHLACPLREHHTKEQEHQNGTYRDEEDVGVHIQVQLFMQGHLTSIDSFVTNKWF